MAALGLLHAWSVLLAPLEEELGLSRAAASGVYSLATAAFALSMLGGHRVHALAPPAAVAAGSAGLSALGLAVAAAGGEWGLWLGWGVLFGIANGIGYGLSLQAAGAVLPERRGFATSLAVTAYALGSAALAPLLEVGIGALGVLDTLGLAAAATALVGLGQLVLLRGLDLGTGGGSGRGRARASAADRAVLRRLWLGFGLGSAAGLVALAHASPIVADRGGTSAAAALAVSLVAVGNAAGRLGGGSLADVLPGRGLLAAAGAGVAAALGLMLALPSAGVAVAALAVVGLGYGAMSSLYPVVTGRHFGAEETARRYGQVFTAWGLAGLGAPLLAGALFDGTGGYDLALALAAAAGAGAALVALRLPR